LPEHGIDQGRLTVIDVRDDGYVPKIHVVNCRSAVRNRENGRRAVRPQVKFDKLATAKPKKKCCRSKPRCKRCPLVLHKVHKAQLTGLRGKELEKVFKRARKA
jgi:hypothetical protein